MSPIVPPVPADVLAQIEAAGLTVSNLDDGLSFVQKLVRSDKSAVVSALLHAAILLVAALGLKLPAKDVAVLGTIVTVGVSYFLGLNLNTKVKAASARQ